MIKEVSRCGELEKLDRLEIYFIQNIQYYVPKVHESVSLN